MAEPNRAEMLEALNAGIAAIARADEPYWAASQLADLAHSVMTEFGVGYRLWWMWSELTDWFELKPEERPEAVATMRRAADEWSAIASDSAARDAYLEHWMFDVLGLDRTIGREF